MKKGFNEIAKYERAIKEKYGQEAIQNPKQGWTEEKEKIYLQHLKEFYKNREEIKETQQYDGFEIIDKKRSRREERTCPTCQMYSLKHADNLYMNKFDCCFDCYIQYIDGREERWKTGWRPNK
jgi:collagenase-like PrtC family protease